MQTCWYGNKYNDSDYVNSPFPSDGATDNTSVSNYQNDGMHLWYPSDNQTFQQYGWREGDLEWTYQRTWTGKDGHATPGCYSWGPGTVSYLMFVNLDQTIEFWWKDTNSSMQNTTQHPINTWTNGNSNPLYPFRTFTNTTQSLHLHPPNPALNLSSLHTHPLRPILALLRYQRLQHQLGRRKHLSPLLAQLFYARRPLWHPWHGHGHDDHAI